MGLLPAQTLTWPLVFQTRISPPERVQVRTLGMLVAKGALSHVCELDGALGAGIHEPVAAQGVELGSCYHIGQLLHVGWLDVDNVEALVLYVQVPEVDTQIITADERLPVAVHRNAVDVVGVRIGIRPARHGRHDGIVVREPWQLQLRCVAELWMRRGARGPAGPSGIRRCEVVREIILGHHLERLFKHLPELDGLVVGREEVVRGVLPSAPFDLVDLLLDLEGLEVVKLGFVRLKLGVELVFAGFFLARRQQKGPRQWQRAEGHEAPRISGSPSRSAQKAPHDRPCHPWLDSFLYDQTLPSR